MTSEQGELARGLAVLCSRGRLVFVAWQVVGWVALP